MNIFFYILLFIGGTMFGSFASVIIYRLHSGESGIWGGRSHCKTCNRNLGASELVPIFSWLFQGGKCKKCKNTISKIYPLLEIVSGFLFLLIGVFLIDFSLISLGNTGEILKLLFFLCLGFLSLIYVFYDILYLEIPESALLIANILTSIALIYQDTSSLGFFSHYFSGNNSLLLGNITIMTLVIGALYTIMLANLKEIYDVLILSLTITIITAYVYISNLYGFSVLDSSLISGTIGALCFFGFFFLQILISGGKWMGGGDLRIAILLGLTFGISLSFPAMMITYFAGSIIGIAMIIYSKIQRGWNTTFESQIPFGPFLACGYFITLFFTEMIQNLIKIYL